MSSHSLRPATDADREWIWETKQLCLGEYVKQTFGTWDEAFQTARFHTYYNAKEIQIISRGGHDVGYVAVDRGAHEFQLFNIMIRPDCQNQRLGTGIMEGLLAEAKQRQVPLRLQVLKVNPARAFYARLGFTLIGETDTHYQMRWSP